MIPYMIVPEVAQHLPEVRSLCQRYGVERMSLFGSATTKDFLPETSDVDCLVAFFNSDQLGILDRYLKLAEGLENVLDRHVDLITEKSIRNPIFRDVIEKSKILIYDDSSKKVSC